MSQSMVQRLSLQEIAMPRGLERLQWSNDADNNNNNNNNNNKNNGLRNDKLMFVRSAVQ